MDLGCTLAGGTGVACEKDIAVGDLNGDGKDDLVIVRKGPFYINTTQTNYLFLNEDETALVDKTSDRVFSLVAGDGFGSYSERDVLIVDIDPDLDPAEKDWNTLDVITALNFGPQPRIRVYINQGCCSVDCGPDPDDSCSANSGTATKCNTLTAEQLKTQWCGLRYEAQEGTDNRIPTFTPALKSCAIAVADVNGDNCPDIYAGDYNNDLEDRLLINKAPVGGAEGVCRGVFDDKTLEKVCDAEDTVGCFVNTRFTTGVQLTDIDGDDCPDIFRSNRDEDKNWLANHKVAGVCTGDFHENLGTSLGVGYMMVAVDLNDDDWEDVYVGSCLDDGFRVNKADEAPGIFRGEVLVTQPTFTTKNSGNVSHGLFDDDLFSDVVVAGIDPNIQVCNLVMGINRPEVTANPGFAPNVTMDDPLVKVCQGGADDGDSCTDDMDCSGVGMCARSRAWNLHGVFDMGIFDLNGDGDPDMWCGTCDGNRLFLGGSNPVLRVKSGATGTDDGSSWTNAYPDLTSALSAAGTQAETTAYVVEVWVAEGTYTPATCTTACTASSSERDDSFVLPYGVALYGGFAGTETLLGTRDTEANVTILSGDLNGDDDPLDDSKLEENSKRVVSVASGSNAELDGFTISDGNTSGSGAGMGVDAGAGPSVRRCIFRDNVATGNGGGMYIADGADGTLVVSSLFFDNEAIGDGAGLHIVGGDPRVIGCTFADNDARGDGGGIYTGPDAPSIRQTIAWGNTDGGFPVNEFAQIFRPSGGNASIEANLIEDEAVGGDAPFTSTNKDADPLFVDAAAGDFSIPVNSPALVTIEGSNGNGTMRYAPAGPLGSVDLAGVVRTSARVDIGAYQFPCPGLFPPIATTVSGNTNRYLEVQLVSTLGYSTSGAIRVTVDTMPAGMTSLEGSVWWAGTPESICELSGKRETGCPPGTSTFRASKLGCTKHNEAWDTGTISLYGDIIVPGGTYSIQLVAENCVAPGEEVFSAALSVTMPNKWADMVAFFDPVTGLWGPPEGDVSVGGDIVALLDKFSNRPTAPLKIHMDIDPAIPDQKINFVDITRTLDAFHGASYPLAAATECP